MNYLTDKPDWRTKVGIYPFTDLTKFISSIGFFRRYCQRLEAEGIGKNAFERYLQSNDGLGLRYKAKLFEDIGAVTVYTGQVYELHNFASLAIVQSALSCNHFGP